MSIFGYGNNTMDPQPELLKFYHAFEDRLRKFLPRTLGFRAIKFWSRSRARDPLGDFIIDAASGGIIKLIEIAWHIGGFIVTIDEPENHLHPAMQKVFLERSVATFPGLQFEIATHSNS